ncbi:hypothetical protein Cni_G02744 [Canna indica]|uniref:non-specific serine/threonine protein kinase n=1 Tax=Canna indica TaxID=4628 RepID=A0AAQ3Q2Z0_9LILI|nr:hypothetical protein Cni_G02744 [Canna indica]
MISFMVVKLAVFLLQQIVMAEYLPGLANQQQQILQEKAALLAFKSKLTQQSQVALTNWNETTNVCEFVGVECSKWQLHVKHLKLSRKLIIGPLSPALANLTGLRELDLSENSLTGYIPEEFSNLRMLVFFDLSRNFLNGMIPPSLSHINRLVFLALGNNNLVGQIPYTIFSNCTELGIIDLSDNALSGQIPSEKGISLPRLLFLNLYLNNFTGTLPTWLSNSSILMQLDVENNHLYGQLPTKTIQELSYLEVLHLSHNLFSSHDKNTNLEPFFLALSNCSNLKELEMAGLGVGGSLPQRIGSRGRKSLSIVSLDDNLITGQIPPDVANLSNLTLLNLSSNLLNGTIPREIFRLPKLERLLMSNNCFTGSIPSEIGNITSVGLLDLSKNNLSGEIPRSIGDLVRLTELYLHKNQLSGSVPSLGRCMSLNKLDLSYNRLSGRIPPEVSGIVKIFYNLSNNQLEGALPLELSKMEQVQEIDLSANNLTGEIIPQLSSCMELRLLNLSHNAFRGQLPASLGGLQNLEVLDVSFNSLDGQIPISLNKCTSLTFLNLSYNDFNGSIPNGGVFSSFNNLSYLGNPHLCQANSERCQKQRRRRSHSHKFLIVVTFSASGMAFILTICCVLLLRKIKKMSLTRSNGDMFSTSSPVVKSSYPRISYLELVEATEDFNQARLVGSGSYGQVYRAVLRDGTVVAVKVLNLQTRNSTRSFKRECQVLKRIRHRNLMRIITACSLPDFKALVLPFMANGSLENQLYSGNSELSLAQRVNICSDIAEGMAYLHHHSPVKVIHCDLKPSNVLLNDEMTALVSDFGIARLVMTVGVGNTIENMGNSTANMLCGSIGYIAPEYAYSSNATTKGDVYSFGILVLEVVTRKRPTDEMFEGGMSLQRWVKSHYHSWMETIIDSSLASTVRHQTPEAKRMWEIAITELLELGLLCTQESPSSRPTMMDAADDLDRLKRYISGDTTATIASSFGMSSSTFGETSLSNFDD